MYGIENIKSALDFAFQFGFKLGDTLEDGKVAWTEVLGFAGLAVKIPNLISHAKDLKNEFLDLTIEEQNEINIYFQDKLDISNDKIEFFIEKAFAWLLTTAELIQLGIDLKS